jgi:AraC-like DNA-binding protein
MVMLLLPLGISFIFYVQMEKILLDNALRSQTVMLEQVKQVIDNKIKEIDQLTLQISLNPEMNWMLEKAIYNEQDFYEFVRFLNELSRYNVANSFVSEFYLYLSQSDTIISSKFKTNLSLIYPFAYQYATMTYDEFVAMITTPHYKDFLPVRGVKLWEDKTTDVITYVQTLPMGAKKDIQGALVVHIHENEVKQLIQRIENASEGAIYILDQRGSALLSAAKHNETLDTLQQNSDYMLASTTSDQENGWTYVSALPKSVVLAKINDMKLLASILMIVIIILGFGVSYLLTRKQYRPIQQIVRYLSRGNLKLHMNEMAYIYNEVAGLAQEGNALKSTLSRFQPIVRTEFINRLIRGQEGNHVTPEYLQSLNLSFPHRYFGVVILDIEDCNGFIKEDTAQEWALIRFVMMNVVTEMLEGDGVVFELERNRMIIILNSAEAHAKDKDGRSERFRRMKEFLEQRFRTVVTIARSGMHLGIEQVARSFGEATMAMDYKMMMGAGSILDYLDVQQLEHSHYQYPLVTELQLMNFAKVGDYGNIERLLSQIREANFTTSSLSPEMSRNLYIDLCSTIIKLMGSLHLNEIELFGVKLDPTKSAEQWTSVDQMFNHVRMLYQQICDKVTESRPGAGEQLYEGIIQYIQLHFHKNALSLTSIADQFQINPTYLSSFFKKQSGENVSNYINNLRMERAKQLLRDTTLTVNEIALSVGYANHIGFIRAFRKHEGITPGQYREITTQHQPT